MGDKHHAILTGSKSTALIHKYMHVCLQACLPMHVNIRANAGNVNSGNGYSRVRVLFMEFDRLSAAYRTCLLKQSVLTQSLVTMTITLNIMCKEQRP